MINMYRCHRNCLVKIIWLHVNLYFFNSADCKTRKWVCQFILWIVPSCKRTSFVDVPLKCLMMGMKNTRYFTSHKHNKDNEFFYHFFNHYGLMVNVKQIFYSLHDKNPCFAPQFNLNVGCELLKCIEFIREDQYDVDFNVCSFVYRISQDGRGGTSNIRRESKESLLECHYHQQLKRSLQQIRVVWQRADSGSRSVALF